MAKSKPIGVRFDLDKLDMIQKEQNLTSVQQVVNYLMDNYNTIGPNLKDKPKMVEIPVKKEKVVKTPENDPKEGTMGFMMKYGVLTYAELKK